MHLEEVQEEKFSRELCGYSVPLHFPEWKKWTLFSRHHSVFNYCSKNNHCLSSRGFITSTCPAPLDYRCIGRLISVFTTATFTVSSAQQASTPFRQHPFSFFPLVPVNRKNSCDKNSEIICFTILFQIFPMMLIMTILCLFLATVVHIISHNLLV